MLLQEGIHAFWYLVFNLHSDVHSGGFIDYLGGWTTHVSEIPNIRTFPYVYSFNMLLQKNWSTMKQTEALQGQKKNQMIFLQAYHKWSVILVHTWSFFWK